MGEQQSCWPSQLGRSAVFVHHQGTLYDQQTLKIKLDQTFLLSVVVETSLGEGRCRREKMGIGKGEGLRHDMIFYPIYRANL